MENYKVIKNFRDKDTEKIFNQGDSYSHESDERIAFLIEEGFLGKEKMQPEYPKHTGGGWYELSNGEKVQGKVEAVVAEKNLGE